VSASLQTVHVRVNDAATGQPTPVRVRFTGPGGTYYAPFGRLTEFATGPNEDVGGNVLLGSEQWAYIDGTCEIALPPGPLHVDICKGPEYLPLHEDLTLAAGKLALRFTLHRWLDLRSEGWCSGDTQVLFLTPHAALLEAAAEDVAVVNLLATVWHDPSRGHAIPNILAFSGQRPALEMPGHLVVVNTWNRHFGTLGSLALLNCHRVVYPLTFGERADNWTLADWCDQCHRKGGLVVWTAVNDALPSEPLADLILGKVDAFQMTGDSAVVQQLWYRLLDAGLRVPLAGGSAKASNAVALGDLRTYARLQPGEPLTYRNWIEALRAGRTFITNGPLLTLTVNGQGPGASVEVPAEAPTIHVRAEARSLVPFEQLEVVCNGEVVAAQHASGEPAVAALETEMQVSRRGWLAARCRGTQPRFSRPENIHVFAHTSPVYFHVPGQPSVVDPTAIATLLGHLDQMVTWVQREARCETSHQREELAIIFQTARNRLRSCLQA
jgi:hypothetical protein